MIQFIRSEFSGSYDISEILVTCANCFAHNLGCVAPS